MSVSGTIYFMKRASLQIKCDLLRVGFIPGVEVGKCLWDPSKELNWNGISWNFNTGGISILSPRIEKCLNYSDFILGKWPHVTFRQISKIVGQIISMIPVIKGRGQLRTRYLQSIVNVRH